MIKAFKILVVTASITLALNASNTNYNDISQEQLLLNDLYACPWWPACKDPEEQAPKPGPTDSSVPKPSGDKDTTKDKKDQTQLA
ncbi:hypothetical protein [Arsukibacterium perlucidum]|uniref:hypothetical protein n=1 Tax=Arsukibacterium perlucidum TaxID=368811 RepID=UPI0003783335|nr:hypothetical protein [Arsukibacterium perlucidum]